MAKDIHSMSRNQLMAAAWPDPEYLQVRGAGPAFTQPKAKPAAAAPAVPAAAAGPTTYRAAMDAAWPDEPSLRVYGGGPAAAQPAAAPPLSHSAKVAAAGVAEYRAANNAARQTFAQSLSQAWPDDLQPAGGPNDDADPDSMTAEQQLAAIDADIEALNVRKARLQQQGQ